MKNLKVLLVLAILTASLSSCYTLEHVVGNGPQTGVVQKKQQWYALYGLIPLNTVDSKAMSGGATDYKVKSQHTFLDQLITVVTSFVTVTVQTVEVTK